MQMDTLKAQDFYRGAGSIVALQQQGSGFKSLPEHLLHVNKPSARGVKLEVDGCGLFWVVVSKQSCYLTPFGFLLPFCIT